MEWLNIHISTLRSPEFIGSNPAERATWLCVLGYSVEQENGGRIVGGATWKDRQWQQACGVTLREVRSADKLLKVSGGDIEVNGYPVAKEAHVRQARGAGMAGAMARWGKGDAERHGVPMPTGMANANAEGKGREGKGREEAPASLSLYVRTTTKDRERTLSNQQALAELIKRFGLDSVRGVAEAICFREHGKIWPDNAELMATLIAKTQPAPEPDEPALPDDLYDLPEGHPLRPTTPRFRIAK